MLGRTDLYWSAFPFRARLSWRALRLIESAVSFTLLANVLSSAQSAKKVVIPRLRVNAPIFLRCGPDDRCPVGQMSGACSRQRDVVQSPRLAGPREMIQVYLADF